MEERFRAYLEELQGMQRELLGSLVEFEINVGIVPGPDVWTIRVSVFKQPYNHLYDETHRMWVIFSHEGEIANEGTMDNIREHLEKIKSMS